MTWLVLGLLLVVALAAVVWVGLRALTVKNELEVSQRLVSEIQNGADVKVTLSELSGHAESAASAAKDPVWSAFELVPVAGDNLRGVRLAAQTLDVLVNGVGMPVLGAEGGSGTLIPAALQVAQERSGEVSRLADEIAEVQDSPSLIGQVRKGVDQVAEVATAAAPALKLLPTLLGADGPRNYLLVFQNNAETLALGGSAAAQTLVSVDKGVISMGAQGDSRSYQNGQAVGVEVPQGALDLYTSYLVDHINTSMSRPDFPTAAQIMRAWWQRDIAAEQIDGVISIDPIALSRVLVATGPIALPTGDTLQADNAVRLLLSDVYARWDSYKQPDLVDGFFAAAAGSVFAKVAGGEFDMKDMAWAVTESAKQGNLLVWSEDAAVAEAIAGQPVSGVIPTDDADATTIGVYFNNSNASKIDYHTRAGVTADAACTADAATFTTTARISLPISQEKADDLPRYVQSYPWGAEKFRDWVYVYGPEGTTVSDIAVDGEKATAPITNITDLGRPVVKLELWFSPGEEVSATVTFAAAASGFGPLQVKTNPMINKPEIAVTNTCKG